MATPETVWAELAKTYTIHAETLAATATELAANHPAASAISIEEARENSLKLHLETNGEDVEFDRTTEEIDAGGVPATVYRPASQPRDSYNVIIFFHGGSLLINSRITHDRSLKALAEQSGVVIVSVEYRLLPCPEAPMAPFDDAVTATRWVMKHRDQIGGGEGKLGLGGDSAGGQIVMGVTREIQSGFDFMVLIYPTVNFDTQLPSCKEFETTPSFNTIGLRWRFAITNGPFPDAENNPRLNAAVRQDLGSSPPAVIVLAQLDPLRDAGTDLAERLKAAGVLVRLHMIEGVPHGFFSLPGVYKTTTARVFAYISDFLKKFQ
ncbi:AB hydrolase superfamily protein c1039.03-like [Plakobranchus ocellatus]|uniref:AB hydrolase superfamily protein c1039.03-like n=1 Tax=Plakobranchus ocellatus TaxID=259542 RepID=A0AAV4ANP5_9GAST|nr:AB hydrolase superfamily protein c1039.03-like [Plakobranchus ocellatus]